MSTEKKTNYGREALAGLTVSFVAISLGAAFGVASGREDGAFVGILSAGVIALITALFGGTRIQCSGPTAPMTAVMATLVAAAMTGVLAPQIEALGMATNQFFNATLILTGVLIRALQAGQLGAAALLRGVRRPAGREAGAHRRRVNVSVSVSVDFGVPS